MTYRLLALDLDGTVVRQDLTISPRVKEAVEGAMAKGVTVTLATTRMFSSGPSFRSKVGGYHTYHKLSGSPHPSARGGETPPA